MALKDAREGGAIAGLFEATLTWTVRVKREAADDWPHVLHSGMTVWVDPHTAEFEFRLLDGKWAFRQLTVTGRRYRNLKSGRKEYGAGSFGYSPGTAPQEYDEIIAALREMAPPSRERNP
jgi:hypothetical protein